MKWQRYSVIAIGIAVCLGLLVPQMVYASGEGGTFGEAACAYYIDPGTGSIIVQVLIGMLVGGLAMMGIYRIRVKNFLLNLFKRRKNDEESDE